MKKFLLLLALVMMGAMWNNVDARWVLGDQKNASQIQPGDTIVLEFCTQESFLGRYLAGSKLSPAGVLTDDNIYFVEEGPLDIRTGAPTVYLKSKEANGYLTYNGGWQTISYSPSPEKAANLQILSCGEDIPWSNTVSWGWESVLREGHEGEDPIASWRNPSSGKVPTDNSVGFSYSPDEKSFTYLGSWNSADNIWFWQYTDTNEWNVYGVSYEKSLQDDLQGLVDLYLNEGEVIGGQDPGLYQQDVADEYNELLQTSLMIAMEQHSDAEYEQAIANLKASHAKLATASIPITEGYYYMVNGFEDFVNNFGVEKAAYPNLSTMTMYMGTFDPTDAKFVFKLEATDNESDWYVQHYISNTYVGKPGNSYNAPYPITTDKDDIQKFRLRAPGLWFWTTSHNFTSLTPYASNAPTATDFEGQATSWGAWGDESTINTHFNLWNLRKITDESILEGFAKEKAQAMRDADLKDLIKQATELYSNLFEYATDYTQGLITRASGGVAEDPAEDAQIRFSTIRKQGIETADQYAFLLDGDSVTYMQGSGYINIKLDEPKQYVTFTYKTRGGNDNQIKWGFEERPKMVNLYGANTLAGDTVYGEPIISNIDMSDLGPHTVNLGRPVNRIAYQVNTNFNGGAYFTLSEFQVYEAKADETASQYYITPGLKEAADAMQALLTPKAAIAAAGETTPEDITEMQNAIKAVKNLYADVDELVSLADQATSMLNGVEVGDEMGQLSDGELATALEAAAVAAREVAAATPVVVADVQAATKTITDAIAAFKAGIKTVEVGKWYFITNLDDKRFGEPAAEDAYCNGNAIYLKDNYANGSITKWGLFDEASMSLNADNNPKAMWTFVPVEGTEYYAIKNLYTGYYLGDYAGDNINLPVSEAPVPYAIPYVGGGQFNLIPMGPANKKKFALWPEGAENDVVCHELDGTTSAWTFVEIDPEAQEAISIQDFAFNLIDVMAVPYNVSGLADYNDDVHTYAVKKIYQEEDPDAEGQLITYVEFYEKDEFAAGEPFMIGLGNFQADKETAPFEDFDLVIPFPTETIDHNVPMVANGIVGGLHTLKFDHITGVSDGKNFNAMNAGSGFGAQTGVIDVMTYTGEVQGVETAYTMVIKGLPALPDPSTPGDVNEDGSVNAADVVAIYNYITDGAESGISEALADVNTDGTVSAADVVAIYSIISGEGAKSKGFVEAIVEDGDNQVARLSAAIGNSDDLTAVPVTVFLTNSIDIVAAEYVVVAPVAPAKFVYDEEEEDYMIANTDRWSKGHNAVMIAGTALHGQDGFFVSITDSKNRAFAGSEGSIATVYFDATGLADGDYEVTVKDGIAVTKATDTYKTADMTLKFVIAGGKATGLSTITAEQIAAAKSITTIDGQAVATPVKGNIYVVDGAVVKY